MLESSGLRTNWLGVRGPAHRRLRVFAFDPMVDRFREPVVAEVPFELVEPGPKGRLVEVVDIDCMRKEVLPPLDLNHHDVLLGQGLPCIEDDPQFHQQMVYAVAMVALDAIERGLGRPLVWTRGQRLKLVPHAGRKADAFFHPEIFALVFGYTVADRKRPGENLPGQTVYTCLSYDVIAHEAAHAPLYELRPDDVDDSPQGSALHEGFADLVALLVRCSSQAVITRAIQETGVELINHPHLLSLASQVAQARGGSPAAVRRYPAKADLKQVGRGGERLDLGVPVVSAMIEGFLASYEAQTSDLVGMHGPARADGWLHPDLVDRLAAAAALLARQVLSSSVAALDYLPPTRPTFGDFLRAFVTTDRLAYGHDHQALRAEVIGAFARREIWPQGVESLAERALVWPESDLPDTVRLPFAAEALLHTVRALEWRRLWAVDRGRAASVEAALRSEAAEREEAWHPEIAKWASKHAVDLGLIPGRPVTVSGLAGAYHTDVDGNVVARSMARLLQPTSGTAESRRWSGGVTLVCDAEGVVQHVIPSDGTVREQRVAWAGAPLTDEHRQLADALSRAFG